MTDNLKPCPFCGKENTVAGSTERMILGWWYACEDCFENRKGGVHEDRWNTRPIEDELNRRIAELESIVDKFAEAGTDLYHRVKAEWSEDAMARVDWRQLMRTYKKDWVI